MWLPGRCPRLTTAVGKSVSAGREPRAENPPVASDKRGRCRLHGGALGSDGLPGERKDNTVTASGPRPRLRSGRNSAHAENAPRWADVMLRAGLT
jgi:hypothetical protein